MSRSYTFTHALCRVPSDTISAGLRAVDSGQPDLERFKHQHTDYIQALRSTGAAVEILPALHDFPDATFIEDAALCLPQAAIIMRPGAPSRLGEAALIAPSLAQYYEEILTIKAPGFIEGGDILVTEREILIGQSARTNSNGINQLRDLTAPWSYTVREVITPPGVLHFKTDCSLLDEDTILSTKRLSASGCFDGYRVIHTAHGEEACANTIRFNNLVIMPEGFPKTRDLLEAEGYTTHEIGNSEAAKLDGGMSCLSLRFSPPKP